jgi:hypothetical protein
VTPPRRSTQTRTVALGGARGSLRGTYARAEIDVLERPAAT